jgi:hypothetical protein
MDQRRTRKIIGRFGIANNIEYRWPNQFGASECSGLPKKSATGPRGYPVVRVAPFQDQKTILSLLHRIRSTT